METVLFQLINWSCVILDPVIYIMYHKKYRRAIDKVLGPPHRKKRTKEVPERDLEFWTVYRDVNSKKQMPNGGEISNSMKGNCGSIGSTYDRLIKNLQNPPTQ